MRTQRLAHIVSVASLIALIFLGLAWELKLAPLRPGGTLLARPMKGTAPASDDDAKDSDGVSPNHAEFRIDRHFGFLVSCPAGREPSRGLPGSLPRETG